MERDREILEAAQVLFFERGFDGVGVDAIGVRAGVSGSAIYRHFEGKNEILAILFDQAIDALLLRIREPTDDPDSDLLQLVSAHVDFAASHRELATIWILEERSLAEPYRRRYQRRQRDYLDRWRVALGRRFPGASSARLASALRAMQWLMLSDALRPGAAARDPDAEGLLVEMALRALTALERDGPRREGHVDRPRPSS